MMFPPDKGTYVLILRLPDSARLTIGKLGTFDFTAGYYAYVGSAFGSGGLRGRLKHHLAPAKRCHWHIDYLRQAAAIHDVWYAVDERVYEHQWADALRALPGAAIPIPRFGASDCKCVSHLIYFHEAPDFSVCRPHTGINAIKSRFAEGGEANYSFKRV